MLDTQILCYLIQDIVASEEYTLQGIAEYAHVPLDTIVDLVSGIIRDPATSTTISIIELHCKIRPHLYAELLPAF